jgi:hypothetical protein
MPSSSDRGLQRPEYLKSFTWESRMHKWQQNLVSNDNDADLSKKSASSAWHIRDVCRATTADPEYYKSVVIGGVKYRDGAIWRPNPALDLFDEIILHSTKKDNPVRLLLNLSSTKPKIRKLLPRPSSLLTRSNEQSVDEHLQRLLHDRYVWFEGPSELEEQERNYVRGDEKFVDRVRSSTERYCRENGEVRKRIDECARSLVQLRQDRARTNHWERFAFGIRYTCSKCPNGAKNKYFEHRDSIITHLMWEHDYLPPDYDADNWNEIQKVLKDSQRLSENF